MAAENRVFTSKKLDYVQPNVEGFPNHDWLVGAIEKGAIGGATSDRKDYFAAMMKWGTKVALS